MGMIFIDVCTYNFMKPHNGWPNCVFVCINFRICICGRENGRRKECLFIVETNSKGLNSCTE